MANHRRRNRRKLLDKKALQLEQAIRCEQGLSARCRCRCHGALHGARRFGNTPTLIDFLSLPLGDPHAVNRRHTRALIVNATTGEPHVLVTA